MAVSVGEKAPDFSLVDQNKEVVSRTDLVGRKALIVFIPFPFTGVCEAELCMLRDTMADFVALDAQVVVITCDTRPSNAKWAADNSYEFPVLSDFWPHGEVARAYGCFNEDMGVANRATFVVDAEGIVRTIISSDQLGTAREHDLYEAALAAV